MSTTMPIDQVRFIKELYPRLKPIDEVIERYRMALDLLPPVIVARDGVLVDGYHRWQAHVRDGVDCISAENLGNLTDAEIFNESIRRNAAHGQQLSKKDKENLAGKLWQTLSHLDKMDRESEIATLLAVSQSKVRDWTKDARKAEQMALEAAVVDAWLNIEGSDRAIAERFGISHPTVADWAGKFCQVWQNLPAESRQDFDVWSFSTAGQDDGQQSYFGALLPQVVENLLWFFTEPGQIVVDPFAGSGTTIDVAKRMGRRVWASDRIGNRYSPHLSIHEHNIADGGWPSGAPRKADLVLLDPPYWQQARGRYSNDIDDMANCSLEVFRAAWAAVAKTCMSHADCVAYIISPTQLEGGVVDHATEMLAPFFENGWHVDRRIIVPYSTQQATGQQVTWARENRRMLKLYRDLVVLTP